MSIFFLGSEMNQEARDIAGRLKKEFNAVFVRTENANDLLKIKDNAVIINVLPWVEEPIFVRLDDMRKHEPHYPDHIEIGSFLGRLEKIGRLKNAKIIGIPQQVDDSVMLTLGRMIK